MDNIPLRTFFGNIFLSPGIVKTARGSPAALHARTVPSFDALQKECCFDDDDDDGDADAGDDEDEATRQRSRMPEVWSVRLRHS